MTQEVLDRVLHKLLSGKKTTSEVHGTHISIRCENVRIAAVLSTLFGAPENGTEIRIDEDDVIPIARIMRLDQIFSSRDPLATIKVVMGLKLLKMKIVKGQWSTMTTTRGHAQEPFVVFSFHTNTRKGITMQAIVKSLTEQGVPEALIVSGKEGEQSISMPVSYLLIAYLYLDSLPQATQKEGANNTSDSGNNSSIRPNVICAGLIQNYLTQCHVDVLDVQITAEDSVFVVIVEAQAVDPIVDFLVSKGVTAVEVQGQVVIECNTGVIQNLLRAHDRTIPGLPEKKISDKVTAKHMTKGQAPVAAAQAIEDEKDPGDEVLETIIDSDDFQAGPDTGEQVISLFSAFISNEDEVTITVNLGDDGEPTPFDSFVDFLMQRDIKLSADDVETIFNFFNPPANN